MRATTPTIERGRGRKTRSTGEAVATRSELYVRLSLDSLRLIATTRHITIPDDAHRENVIQLLRAHDERPAARVSKKPRAGL